MKEFAEPLARLVEEFEKLPGVGARTAERLAYHVLKIEREPAMALARAIRDVKDSLRPCSVCHNIAEADLCWICRADDRDRTRICVVEHAKDLIALEKSGAYQGLYHVLLGRLDPQRGKGPGETTISSLRHRLETPTNPAVEEVILATNPDAEGDATALALKEVLKDLPLKISRIARGLPSGGSIEFANVEILKDALQGRVDVADH
ncbi:MAG: recombination mediator RecR [Planctomycetota bacterium]